MRDDYWIALFMFAKFAGDKEFKLLTSDSFDEDYDKMLSELETTESEILKGEVIDFTKKYRDRLKRLNEISRKVQTDAEYKTKVISSIGVESEVQDDSH